MHLWDEGVFDPQKPVREYLPWWDVQTGFEPITGHHLVTHTSGIPSNRDDIYGSLYMARALREQAAAWPRGEKFHYSNVGYQTLHVLLEELADEAYAHLIGRLILEPLGMNHTNAAITLETRSSQAVGYVPAYDDRPHHPSRPLVEAPFMEYGLGDGSIQSTATDMAAYMRMLMKRGQGPSSRIVSEAAFEIFTRKGQLLAAIGIGSETGSGEMLLQPRGEGIFHPGEDPTPELLRFEDVVEGQALRAVWSGHEFYRISW